jgi:hypothetical protein
VAVGEDGDVALGGPELGDQRVDAPADVLGPLPARRAAVHSDHPGRSVWMSAVVRLS